MLEASCIGSGAVKVFSTRLGHQQQDALGRHRLHSKASRYEVKILASLRLITLATNPEQSVLLIADARPRTNALANFAVGGGFEQTGSNSAYPHCSLQFLNIGNASSRYDFLVISLYLGVENIHVVRESRDKLIASVVSRTKEKLSSPFHPPRRIEVYIMNYISLFHLIIRRASNGWTMCDQFFSGHELWCNGCITSVKQVPHFIKE